MERAESTLKCGRCGLGGSGVFIDYNDGAGMVHQGRWECDRARARALKGGLEEIANACDDYVQSEAIASAQGSAAWGQRYYAEHMWKVRNMVYELLEGETS